MLVRNGHVVTEGGVFQGDVLVEEGRIAALGSNLSGDPVVDATDCWVLPGAIDPHVHTLQEGYSPTVPMIENLEVATRTALFGGVTSVCGYAHHLPGRTLGEALRRQMDFGRDTCSTDFGLNALVLPGDDIEASVAEGFELGVTTFKAMFAYHRSGMMMEDDDAIRLMFAVGARGGLVLVHAENGRAIDILQERERAAGKGDNGSFLRTQPGVLEAEGMFRATMFSRLTGCPILFVHLSSKEGAATLQWLKAGPDRGRVFSETQPHYLCRTNDEVLERGPLGKVGPPLKEADDVDAVWHSVDSGLVDLLSSDHSPRDRALKLTEPDILDAPYGGISGTEVLLPLAFGLGVASGRFDIVRLAHLTSTNAAKLYGLYPRKGSIRPGADADLVLVPRDGEEVAIEPAVLHGPSDYSLYEGLSSSGFPRTVIRHGRVAVHEGQLVDNPPGRYLHRTGTNLHLDGGS